MEIVWAIKDNCKCVWAGWNDLFSSVYNHKPHTHTHSHWDPCPPLLPHLFSSSALSILTTLDQDPVTDPPKRDWLQERRSFCLPFPFCVSQFSRFSFLPCHYLSSLFVYLTLSSWSLFSPLSSYIWKHPARGFTSTNSSMLPFGGGY